MTSPFGPLLLIVNPRAGRGAAADVVLPRLTAALTERGLEYDVVQTTGQGDAAEAARRGLADGFRFLVAVGGDGTVHEVVNGMVDGDYRTPSDVVLGVVAAGSGCDFIRTFGLDRKPEVVAKHLTGDAVMPIDLGLVRYHRDDGTSAVRVFANIAEVGFGAEAVRRAARLPRWIGRVRYLLAAWVAIGTLHRQEARIAVSQGTNTMPLVNLVVANAQFFGGGMKVAPRALPDDGRFNVQVFTGQRSQVFMLTPKIYRGEHLPHPNIAEWQSPTVEVDVPERLAVEADGEVLGWTPARFEVIPHALRLKI